MLIVTAKRFRAVRASWLEAVSERDQLREKLHTLEILVARQETELMILRSQLKQRELSNVTLPPQGGFFGFSPESEDDPNVAEYTLAETTGFSQRIDEMFGQGLSVEELDRRRDVAIANMRQQVEAERTAVQAELAELGTED